MKKTKIENRRLRWLKKNKLACLRLLVLITFFVLGILVGILLNVDIEEPPKAEPQVFIEKEEVQEQQAKLTEMEMVVTAYCPCEECCGKDDGITATGTHATAGRTIAVDPEVIPYGTEVVISGEKYIAEDCGEAIKGRRIDVYFDSHAEAEAYGVKETTCTWVKED